MSRGGGPSAHPAPDPAARPPAPRSGRADRGWPSADVAAAAERTAAPGGPAPRIPAPGPHGEVNVTRRAPGADRIDVDRGPADAACCSLSVLSRRRQGEARG